VIMLVSHPSFKPQTVSTVTTTTQVAPTMVQALGLNPNLLDAVNIEGTSVLPEVFTQLGK
jgi:arylsulfatase A-like enzyme